VGFQSLAAWLARKGFPPDAQAFVDARL